MRSALIGLARRTARTLAPDSPRHDPVPLPHVKPVALSAQSSTSNPVSVPAPVPLPQLPVVLGHDVSDYAVQRLCARFEAKGVVVHAWFGEDGWELGLGATHEPLEPVR